MIQCENWAVGPIMISSDILTKARNFRMEDGESKELNNDGGIKGGITVKGKAFSSTTRRQRI